MKNSNLFLLLAAVFALASCGTYTYTAQQGGSQFRNSIYYTPGSTNSQEYIQEQQYMAELQEKTDGALQNVQTQSFDASTNTMTVQVGDNNVVDIEYNPNVTYRIVDDQESYEARLRKFDSPTYTINIEMGTTPWWGLDWRTSWYGRHYSWYRSSWRWYNSWYFPWSHPWYGAWNSPWYADYMWGFHTPYYDPFYDPFYSPWWGHYYGPGFYYPNWHLGYYPGHHHHYPGFHPGHGPGAPSHGHGKDVRYGKRNDSPSYKDVRRGNSGSMASGAAANKPSTGSVTRRPQTASQNRDVNATHNKQGAVNNPDKKQTNATNRNHNNSSNRGSYTRSSSQQTRSNSSSYSQSGSYGGGRSSGATHSSGGGSSYRRR